MIDQRPFVILAMLVCLAGALFADDLVGKLAAADKSVSASSPALSASSAAQRASPRSAAPASAVTPAITPNPKRAS